MKGLVSEAAFEILAVVGSRIGAAAFTIGGLITEQDGLQKVMAGQTTLGGWEAVVGFLFVVVGVYFLGYQEFWQRLRAFQSR